MTSGMYSIAYAWDQELRTQITSAFAALRLSAIWGRNLYLGLSLFIFGLLNPTIVQAVSTGPFSQTSHDSGRINPTNAHYSGPIGPDWEFRLVE